jgi:hypothetical protein
MVSSPAPAVINDSIINSAAVNFFIDNILYLTGKGFSYPFPDI